MARRKYIPISINKIKTEASAYRNKPKREVVEYQIEIEEQNQNWSKIFTTDREGLKRFRDEINEILDSLTTKEILEISSEEAELIDKHYNKDPLCQGCQYKLTSNCKTCLLILQSPLERKLFLELKNNNIRFNEQYPLSWKGHFVDIDPRQLDSEKVKFHNILTIPDFYIEKGRNRLCVYTDGHTYHERTEDQAKRDRNIDRKLQDLGFTVLRYTGKEVNENIQKIITEIQRWIAKW